MPATLVDKAPAYEVLRPFTALGRELQRGETITDVSGFRNLQPLVNNRYMKPLHSVPVAKSVPAKHDGAADPIPVAKVLPAPPAKSPPRPATTPKRGPGRPKKVVA